MRPGFAGGRQAAVRRAGKATSERAVTLRPAPDTMAYLTGLLPVTRGVATYAALSTAADEARAAGDPRSRGQLMADILVERVTGQATAAATPVQLQVVMTDRTLLHGSDEPAVIPGYGDLIQRTPGRLELAFAEYLHRQGDAA